MAHPASAASASSTFYSILGKATWSLAYINQLPDDAFLVIEPGGKVDASGRTQPRSLRHLPYKDAEGHVDLPHLRNAIAQIPKAGPWLTDDERTALQDKARRILERATATTHKAAAGVPDWALPYLMHLDRTELLSIPRDAAHKAWKGDAAIAKRATDWLGSYQPPAKTPPTPEPATSLPDNLATVARVSAAYGIQKAAPPPKIAAATERTLREKVALHNQHRGADPTRKATLGQLRNAFLRGADAYKAARRPMVKSRAQWGFGRVNAYLSLLGKGEPARPGYVADNDLLPAGHPRSSRPVPAKKDEMGTGDLAQGGLLAPEQDLQARRFRQIPILLDRPKGFVQTGVGNDGQPWERTYTEDYGYIPSTAGGDGEELDVFLGDDTAAPDAYVAVQTTDDGAFDELKVMLGYPTEEAARAAYVAHIPERYLSTLTPVPVALLEALLGMEPLEAARAVQKAAGRSSLCIDGQGRVAVACWPTAAASPGAEGIPSPPGLDATVAVTMSVETLEGLAKAARAVQALLPPEATAQGLGDLDGLTKALAGDVTSKVFVVSALDAVGLSPVALAASLRDTQAPVLAEMPDTPAARTALKALAPFTVANAPGRLFVATYPLPNASGVTAVDAACAPAVKEGVALSGTVKVASEEHTIVVKTGPDGLAAIRSILCALQRTGDVGHGCLIAYEDGGYFYQATYFDGDGADKLDSITIDGKEVVADPTTFVWNNKTIDPVGEVFSPAKLAAYRQRTAERTQKSDLTFLAIGKAATETEPAEERYVLGPVLIPDRADLQGDIYSAEEIRATAFAWMARYQNLGVQHAVDAEKIVGFRQDAPGLVTGTGFELVESYIVQDDRGAADINGRSMPTGTWMLGAKVVDDALWERVKAGLITGWSIGGFARREPLAA